MSCMCLLLEYKFEVVTLNCAICIPCCVMGVQTSVLILSEMLNE